VAVGYPISRSSEGERLTKWFERQCPLGMTPSAHSSRLCRSAAPGLGHKRSRGFRGEQIQCWLSAQPPQRQRESLLLRHVWRPTCVGGHVVSAAVRGKLARMRITKKNSLTQNESSRALIPDFRAVFSALSDSRNPRTFGHGYQLLRRWLAPERLAETNSGTPIEAWQQVFSHPLHSGLSSTPPLPDR
jgi:hypothetical protein